MIAKVIAHGATRDEALDRLSAALGDMLVAGPKTNVAFLRKLADNKDFRAQKLDTGLIERDLEGLGAVPQPLELGVVAAAGERLLEREMARLEAVNAARNAMAHDPWSEADGFQFSGPRGGAFAVEADGESVVLTLGFAAGAVAARAEGVPAVHADEARFITAGDALLAVHGGRQVRIRRKDMLDADIDAPEGGAGGAIKAPMHGKLIALMVAEGDVLEKGQKLAVVEAMKMEHALVAPHAGRVATIAAEVGAQVAEGATILTIEAEA
jgi:3-methylcrotonyl-CoA carboxylase alpha subunit